MKYSEQITDIWAKLAGIETQSPDLYLSRQTVSS